MPSARRASDRRAAMRTALATLFTIAVVAGLALWTAAAAQERPRLAGRILVPRGPDLWSTLAAGGGEQVLAAAPAGSLILDVAAEPGGRRMVFSRLLLPTRDGLGGADLYLLPLQGGEPTLLLAHDAPGAMLTTPAWAPGSDSVLFTYTPYSLGAAGAEAQPRIERVQLDSHNRTVLLEQALSPALSPDGRLLAYLRRTPQGDALWVAEGGVGPGRELIPPTRFLGLAYPRVAPDGASVAVAATVDLPALPAPGPAPRGAGRLAARAAHGLPWDVWLVSIDGRELRRLTYLLEDDPSLAWSPDGRWLAIQGGYGLTLVEVSTAHTERLTRQAAFGAIDWVRE
jgi:dipeptidyl aminopeptidase/acylaminoacyl peptidase